MNPIESAKMRSSRRDADHTCGKTVRLTKAAVPSVVRVRFPSCSRELDYFNDKFDLQPGDAVFVDGKLAGQRGRVTAVSTHFRIRPDDYKRVIGLADTCVSGEFLNAGSYLVTFDLCALPYSRFRSWVLPPLDGGTEYFVCFGADSMDLNAPAAWPFAFDVMSRGTDYYRSGRVQYLSLDGARGRAIVDGTRPYEVRFEYDGGRITDLTCSCPCGYHCKHEAAVLLQLREILEVIEKRYPDARACSGGFSAVRAPLLVSLAVEGNDRAILTLEQSAR